MDVELLEGFQENMEDLILDMKGVQRDAEIKDEKTRLLAIAITNLETSYLYLKEVIFKIKD